MLSIDVRSTLRMHGIHTQTQACHSRLLTRSSSTVCAWGAQTNVCCLYLSRSRSHLRAHASVYMCAYGSKQKSPQPTTAGCFSYILNVDPVKTFSSSWSLGQATISNHFVFCIHLFTRKESYQRAHVCECFDPN